MVAKMSTPSRDSIMNSEMWVTGGKKERKRKKRKEKGKWFALSLFPHFSFFPLFFFFPLSLFAGSAADHM